MNLEAWIILHVVTFLAAILRGAIGMGFALMVLPFFLIYTKESVPVVVILIGLLLSVLVVVRDRHAMDLSGLKFSLSGRFIGNIIGAWAIAYISGSIFEIIIAVMILLAVFISFLPHKFSLSPGYLVFGGLGSGIMGTISSLDGPPIALLYQHHEGDVIRATLGAYFIVGSILSLGTLAVAGKVEIAHLWLFLYLSPSAVLGYYVSKYLIGILPQKLMRFSILSISTISAVLIIIRCL